MLKSLNNIVEGSAHVMAIALALLLIGGVIGSAGCRVVSYAAPDGTRAFGASVLTEPKGTFTSERSPTTQRTSTGYESKSNAAQAVELLKAIK